MPRSQFLRTLLPGCLLVMVLLGPSACLQPVGSTGGTVEIDVLPGETASGSLYSGQELRAIGSVQRGHIYSVSASLSAATPGSTGPDVITGLISGAPLAEPVEFAVESSWDGGSQSVEPPK